MATSAEKMRYAISHFNTESKKNGREQQKWRSVARERARLICDYDGLPHYGAGQLEYTDASITFRHVASHPPQDIILKMFL